jgi:hypothetical protein
VNIGEAMRDFGKVLFEQANPGRSKSVCAQARQLNLHMEAHNLEDACHYREVGSTWGRHRVESAQTFLLLFLVSANCGGGDMIRIPGIAIEASHQLGNPCF